VLYTAAALYNFIFDYGDIDDKDVDDWLENYL